MLRYRKASAGCDVQSWTAEARNAYGRALELVADDAERRLLERKLAELEAAPYGASTRP
jgi:predicted RNA polymerase sigma factor